MNFDLTDDQKMLVETVVSFVRKDSPVERLRKMRKHEIGWEKNVWKQMGELGWLGVMFPESVGGAGMTFVEAGLIIEQLGATLVPEPYTPLVVAGSALLSAGSNAQQEQFLTPSVAGDESLALAYLEEQSRNDLASVVTRAEKSGSGFKLSGSKRWVLNGHAADRFVVSARSAGGERDQKGIGLFVVDPSMKGVKLTKVECMDSTRAAMVELDGVEVGADRVLGDPEGGLATLDLAVDYGAAAACAEGSGACQRVLQMTRNYLTERKQFGVAIGTFHALQHRAVDMFLETELLKGTAILAMLKIASSDVVERQRAISAAKAQLSVSGGFVTRQGTQLHGGIGVTDEHDVGLYFKRLHVLGTLFGDEPYHVQRFASLPTFTRHVA